MVKSKTWQIAGLRERIPFCATFIMEGWQFILKGLSLMALCYCKPYLCSLVVLYIKKCRVHILNKLCLWVSIALCQWVFFHSAFCPAKSKTPIQKWNRTSNPKITKWRSWLPTLQTVNRCNLDLYYNKINYCFH